MLLKNKFLKIFIFLFFLKEHRVNGGVEGHTKVFLSKRVYGRSFLK